MSETMITFTGADNNTSIAEMLDLSERFHNIEFGILIGSDLANEGENFEGKPRYPNLNWINSLPESLNLSLHLCGKFAKFVLDGTSNLDKNVFFSKFRRIQLNLGKNIDKAINKANELERLGDEWEKEIIVGGHFHPESWYLDFHHVSVLLDGSGGKGVIGNWFQPVCICKFGIAGGISLSNILEVKEKVDLLKCDWIDIETSLRNEFDQFDLSICEDVLNLFHRKPFVPAIKAPQPINGIFV